MARHYLTHGHFPSFVQAFQYHPPSCLLVPLSRWLVQPVWLSFLVLECHFNWEIQKYRIFCSMSVKLFVSQDLKGWRLFQWWSVWPPRVCFCETSQVPMMWMESLAWSELQWDERKNHEGRAERQMVPMDEKVFIPFAQQSTFCSWKINEDLGLRDEIRWVSIFLGGWQL